MSTILAKYAYIRDTPLEILNSIVSNLYFFKTAFIFSIVLNVLFTGLFII